MNIYFSQEQDEYTRAMYDIRNSFEDHEYEECIRKTKEIKDNYYFNKKADALLIEGKSYMELEQYEKAIDSFKAALEIEDSSEGYSNMAVCYAKTGNSTQALKILESEFSDRKDINSYIRAEILTSKREYSEAADEFYRAIELTGDDSLKRKAYIEIARIYEARRHEAMNRDDGTNESFYLSRQIDIMEEAMRELKIEDDLTLTEMMGEAYFTAQQYDLSLIKFNRLLELGYDRPHIYINIAVIHQQQGDFKKAEKILLDMKKNHPTEYTCYVQLAFVYIQTENAKPQSDRDYSNAVKNYELAKKHAGSDNARDLEQLERTMQELEDKGWI